MYTVLGLNFINSTRKHTNLTKFRTSRKLKNIILSIVFAILTFFKLFVQFSEKCLGQHKKTGSVGLAETPEYFLGHIFYSFTVLGYVQTQRAK